MRTEIVLAGTFEQYRHFIKANGLNPENVIYITRVQDLFGLEISQVYRIGTWSNREDIDALEDELRSRRIKK